jgi:hypothetical protein
MPNPRGRRPFPWRAVAIYLAIVVVAGIGLIVWDRSYEARLHAPLLPSRAAPLPETAARNLVENVVGSKTVLGVTLDHTSGTLTMDVKDVVSDKSKTPAENQALLSREGAQAAQAILGLISFKRVVLHLVKDGKTLATVRAEPGKPAQTEFAPDLK